ncbi:unnamed protein product [Peronospora effusa]|nr:unnamed protein product [Peronospora effusa]
MQFKMRFNAKDNSGITLKSYSDADFAADKGDRKFLTGSMVLLSGMPVSWAAKKQGGVSLSTIEAESVAASRASWNLRDADGTRTSTEFAYEDACGLSSCNLPY